MLFLISQHQQLQKITHGTVESWMKVFYLLALGQSMKYRVEHWLDFSKLLLWAYEEPFWVFWKCRCESAAGVHSMAQLCRPCCPLSACTLWCSSHCLIVGATNARKLRVRVEFHRVERRTVGPPYPLSASMESTNYIQKYSGKKIYMFAEHAQAFISLSLFCKWCGMTIICIIVALH